MANEEKEEKTEEQAEERRHILQEAEKVVKTPDIIEAIDTGESEAEKALKILLGEEK